MFESRGRVTVNLDAPNENADWLNRLFALGEFFLKYTKDTNTELVIHAYECEYIGGLRIGEVTFSIEREGGGISFSSYERGCPEETGPMIFLIENFLATYGQKPVRPQGWDSCLNLHGEARIAILRSMGMNDEADQEYQLQLEEEKDIPEEVN